MDASYDIRILMNQMVPLTYIRLMTMNLSMSIMMIAEIMVITPLLLNNDDIQLFIIFFKNYTVYM